MSSSVASADRLGRAAGAQGDERCPDLVDFLLTADLRGTDALIEAGELYGGDADRELADLEAGQHPVQRSRLR